MTDTMGNIVEDRAKRVLLADEYMDLVAHRTKTSTVRKGMRDFYPGQTIALKAVESGEEVFVYVTDVTFKFAEDLTDADASRDGFTDEPALRAALLKIYPDLDEDCFVTIIGFEARNSVA